MRGSYALQGRHPPTNNSNACTVMHLAGGNGPTMLSWGIHMESKSSNGRLGLERRSHSLSLSHTHKSIQADKTERQSMAFTFHQWWSIPQSVGTCLLGAWISALFPSFTACSPKQKTVITVMLIVKTVPALLMMVRKAPLTHNSTVDFAIVSLGLIYSQPEGKLCELYEECNKEWSIKGVKN